MRNAMTTRAPCGAKNGGHLLREASLRIEVTFHDRPKDPVNGLVARDRHVQDEEMPREKKLLRLSTKNGSPLQPLWDVVPSTARMDHGCKVTHVLLKKASCCFNVPILEPRQCAWQVLFFLNRTQQICCISYRQGDEVSRLIQTVEPFLLDDSTEQLIGDLQRK